MSDFEKKQENEEKDIDQVEETEQDQADDVNKEAELAEELEKVKDQNLRLQAEIQNMQKRHRSQREDAAKFRSQKLAETLIPAIDNLERALTIQVDDEAGQNLKKGIEMVYESIQAALKEEDIEMIDPKGQAFDPNFHEAVAQVQGQEGQESGTVAEVIMKGYVLHDRVLRAAQVAVVQ